MRKIDVSDKSFHTQNSSGIPFILLGSKEAMHHEFIDRIILPKVKKEVTFPVPGFWGTLGMANDTSFHWHGHLEFSADGNENSDGVTRNEISLIYNSNPLLNGKSMKVKEKFICFDDISFENFPETFSIDDLPHLRLTVMLGEKEGALVYFQHNAKDEAVAEGDIEYILPEPTPSHNTNKRDRLTYIFPILPQYKIEETEVDNKFRLSDAKHNQRFVIKILTFKRDGQDSDSLIQKLINKLEIVHKPQLLKYNPKSNEFVKITETSELSSTAKTLFLVHGTFADTEESFGEIRKSEWLKFQSKIYTQIIAFDHPTIPNGAKENVDALFEMLGDFKFNSVDAMAGSQGALIVKYLAQNKKAQKHIPIRKAIFLAAANGSGYFTTGKYIAKFLSVSKILAGISGNPFVAVIAGIAQHSAEFVLQQPGFVVMTPGSERLKEIIENPPEHPTIYLPINGDFDKSIVENKKLFKRWKMRGIDLLIKQILGKEHDFVIGAKEQYIAPSNNYAPGYEPDDYKSHQVKALHGKYLELASVIKEIEKFLELPHYQGKREGFFTMIINLFKNKK